MEQLEHFGLARDPFRNEVQLEFWFSSRAHVDVGRRLRRCVEQGKALCVLVGPIGSGTTTIVRALIEQLDPETYEAGVLVPPRGVDADALRSAIARQLGVETPAAARSDALRQLYARLMELRAENRRAVIAIDEAQTLGVEVLHEVQALSNLECDETRLLSIVLVGSPQLEVTLGRDADLLARVELRLRLDALVPAEASAYVLHRVDVAGGNQLLFAPDVLALIVERAGGLPRRLNALADNTLYEAHLEGRPRPSCIDVERAARDLPWGQGAAGKLDITSVLPGVPEKLDDGLDDGFEAEPSLEALHDPGSSASFRDLDIHDLDGDLGAPVAPDLDRAQGDDGLGHTAHRRATLDLTIREAEISADLIGPEQTAPGAWHTASPLRDDDDTNAAGHPGVAHITSASELLPDADELDGLFVDLVDEAEPER